MTNELAKISEFDIIVAEIEKTQQLCRSLMQTKHYQALGETGIFAILQKSKSIGMNPMEALNGGMYFVSGKVELTANSMNYLIRSHGHSITKDPKSDTTICILKGKRADNGDIWSSSFSIQDAQTAGIYRNQWLKYPEDMLFARALSRLARQLFPDVIKGCYVEGEISQAAPLQNWETVEIVEPPKQLAAPVVTISKDQADLLDDLIGEDAVYRKKLLAFLDKNHGIKSLSGIPALHFESVHEKALLNSEKNKQSNELSSKELAAVEEEVNFIVEDES